MLPFLSETYAIFPASETSHKYCIESNDMGLLKNKSAPLLNLGYKIASMHERMQ